MRGSRDEPSESDTMSLTLRSENAVQLEDSNSERCDIPIRSVLQRALTRERKFHVFMLSNCRWRAGTQRPRPLNATTRIGYIGAPSPVQRCQLCVLAVRQLLAWPLQRPQHPLPRYQSTIAGTVKSSTGISATGMQLTLPLTSGSGTSPPSVHS